MAVRKDKGHWAVNFQSHLKRHRYYSPENTREGALAYEALLRHELAQHGNLDRIFEKVKKSQQITFTDFVGRWLREYVYVTNRPAEGRAKRHILKGHLLPTFGNHPLNKINTAMIDQFKAGRIKFGLSPKTINNILTVLRKCLVTAQEWGELQQDVPRFKFLRTTLVPIQYLTQEESKRLLVSFTDNLWRSLAFVALQTGLRISELIALTWEDIDLTQPQLCVKRSCVEGELGPPKNGRIRYVPLTAEVCWVLNQLPRNGDLVFQRQGNRIVYEAAYAAIERACNRAGIKRISWHTLRRTFASDLVMRGASLQAVKDLLGHSTMNVTLRYAHLAPEMLSKTIALLEPVSSPDGNRMSAMCQLMASDAIKTPSFHG